MAWDKRGDLGFHWRGGEVSRLEGFSDAVFGFALTLLVVSLEVPKSFDQMWRAMRGLGAFAFSFALLLTVWEKHYRFFRRFGLQDGATIVLNSCLLFVVLFYVYPLKFMATAFVESVLLRQAPTGLESWEEAVRLYTIFGAGFAAVSLLFAALYGYAWQRRKELELDLLEQTLTRGEIYRNLLLLGIAGTSIALASTLPLRLKGLAGYCYFLIGFVEGWHGWHAGRATARAAAQ